MGPPPSTTPTPFPFDRQFWLAILIAACVVIPRTALVSRAHSEYWDDQYHLRHGLTFILHRLPGDMRQDAPLGQAVISLPLLVTGSLPHPDSSPGGEQSSHPAVLYDQKLPRQTLSLLVALWKAVLFLPLAGLVFHWCRQLYGLRGAWLGLALVLVDPTIAGHIAPASLDVPGATAGLFACFFAWRYFESPTTRRLIVAGVAVAAAMLTKHTAIITPGVVAVFALAHWLHDRRGGTQPANLRRRFNQLLAVGVIAFVALWPLSLFDVSRPIDHGPPVNAEYTEAFSFKADVINGALMRPWPAGAYIGSVRGGQLRAEGHDSYLWGKRSWKGWWYYYPAVALYKIPLGIALVLAAATASLPLRVRPRFGELPLVLAFVCWAAFLMLSNVHIGWRHFLPAYVPLLMIAARAAAADWRPLRRVAWAGVAIAAVHGLLWHPDYLSYINFPRDRPYLAISDSNIDWGQSLKQARAWLDAHPQGDRPVWIGYFGSPEGRSVAYYLGDHVQMLKENDAPPDCGLLILSPVWLAGVYGDEGYAFLRARTPDAVIGHNLLVYDLDRLAE
jgi:hypothetical protein